MIRKFLSALMLTSLYFIQCFIIWSPLLGVNYTGYVRSSRHSPGFPHNDPHISYFLSCFQSLFGLSSVNMVPFLFPDRCLEAACLLVWLLGPWFFLHGLLGWPHSNLLYQDNSPLLSMANPPPRNKPWDPFSVQHCRISIQIGPWG